MSCCATKPKDNFNVIEKPIAKPSLLGKIKPYHPLITMFLVVLLGSVTLSIRFSLDWMALFMGLFLLNFSMFKLFDIRGFTNSFAMYDVIGKRSRTYALLYPFIELVLAIGFLSSQYLDVFSALTALIMGIGLIGVIQSRLSGSQTRCACMGSLINVPVGSITILENTSMIIMAILMLIHSF